MRIEPSYKHNWAFLMNVGKFLSNILSERRLEQSITPTSRISDISEVYENFEPYSLGVYYGDKLQRRDRKSIYTEYKTMMQDPTIHACLNLLVTAALGGHESRGEVVFIRPSDKIMGKGTQNTELRKMVDQEAEYLQSMLNNIIFVFSRNGVGYGDSYMRVYPKTGLGITNVICDETVDPPLIQAFEQGGRTVGFHALEISDYEVRQITKLGPHQMLRMKMQRITPLPQFRIDHVLHKKLLDEDDINKIPIIPSPVGGSFLQAVAPAWRDWMISFSALNSQQIADSVNNQFLTMDMSAMPEANREKYKQGLKKSLLDLHEKVKKALSGNEPLWTTNWTFLPTWGEKQILNPMGDLTKRTSPMSLELSMTHLKRGVGALGLDLSLVGWMDLISGGLGDGGAFHTSAQSMQQSALIRQSLTEPLISFCLMHFAYKHGKVFKRGDLPFKIEFYSDISAAATESLNNKQTRASTTSLITNVLLQMKDLGLGEETNRYLLTDSLGMDDDPAMKIAKELAKKSNNEGANGEGGNFDGGEEE